MINYPFRAGQTSASMTVRIIDATTGAPVTTIVYNTAGFSMSYRRELAVDTAITLATLAALNTAWATGGFKHINDGYYRVDVPDAAFAAGSSGVLLHGTGTGIVVVGSYAHLTSENASDVAAAILAAIVEGTRTVVQSFRLLNSLLAGRSSGFVLGVGNATFRDIDNTKDRIVVTVDANGNRTAITPDLT